MFWTPNQPTENLTKQAYLRDYLVQINEGTKYERFGCGGSLDQLNFNHYLCTQFSSPGTPYQPLYLMILDCYVLVYADTTTR